MSATSTGFTSKEVVQRYLDAFSRPGSKEELTLILSPDVRVRSPLGDFSNADDFLADANRDRLMIESLKVDLLISDGQRVSALYRLESGDPDIGEVMVSEWFEVQDARIVSITSNFDASQVRESMMRI